MWWEYPKGSALEADLLWPLEVVVAATGATADLPYPAVSLPLSLPEGRSGHRLNSILLAFHNQGSVKNVCVLYKHNQGLCQWFLTGF